MTAAKRLNGRYPCPCCGSLSFAEPPGSHAICPCCFWEDDSVQAADPWFGGGANVPSLAAAQGNYAAVGAVEARFRARVRPRSSGDGIDPDWRPLRESDRGR